MINFIFAAFLAHTLAAPNYAKPPSMTHAQAQRRASQITQRLRKENPLVLRWVLRQMGWVPKVKYTKERKQRQESEQAFDDWYIGMMRSLGGL
jgi:hypothetical protein